MRLIMFIFPFFLVFFYLKGVLNAGFSFFRPKTIRVDRFIGRCPEHPNAPITMDNIRIMKVKRVYTFSCQITVRDTVKNDFKLQVVGTRCKNKDSPDTCEQYQPVNMRRMCELIDSTNHPWSPFMEQMKPRYKCPIQKGVYRVTNGTFDGNGFSALPIEDWYWKVKATTTENVTNRVLMCVYLEGQIVPV